MIRSLFFAPANRPDLLAKMPRAAADCNVIDLEDGTPEPDKQSARRALKERLDLVRAGQPRGMVCIRVNAPRSAHHFDDLRAAAQARPDGIVIPKLESPQELTAAFAAMGAEEGAIAIVAGIESIRGVMDINKLLAATRAVTAVYFGAEDFASEMGARRTAAGLEVLYARSRVVLAARAAGIVAIDQAVGEVRDDERFRADACAGRELGFHGKICVTPRQVTLAHEAFTPTPEEIELARRMLAAYAQAVAHGQGTVVVDGMLVEGPLVKRAESIVALAESLAQRA